MNEEKWYLLSSFIPVPQQTKLLWRCLVEVKGNVTQNRTENRTLEWRKLHVCVVYRWETELPGPLTTM
jgi:hypothetical protein